MTVELLNICDNLIKNNKVLKYETIVDKLANFINDDSTINEVLKYFNSKNVTIIMPEAELENNSNITTELNTNDTVKWYLSNIAPTSRVLTAEEEKELCAAAQSGDICARNKLICHNLRLVVKVAKKYSTIPGLDIMDIIQSGNLGLMKAIDNFDISLGYKFSTYAIWWIRQAILRSIANDSRNIRIPVHASEMLKYIHKARDTIIVESGQNPTYADIADYMNEHNLVPGNKLISEKSVRTYINVCDASNTVSMSTPVSQDDEDYLIADCIPDETENIEKYSYDIAEAEYCQYIFDKYLSKREQDILKKRLGINCNEPMSLKQIADIYNLSRERIRQIERQAKRKFYVGYRLQEKLADS